MEMPGWRPWEEHKHLSLSFAIETQLCYSRAPTFGINTSSRARTKSITRVFNYVTASSGRHFSHATQKLGNQMELIK